MRTVPLNSNRAVLCAILALYLLAAYLDGNDQRLMAAGAVRIAPVATMAIPAIVLLTARPDPTPGGPSHD